MESLAEVLFLLRKFRYNLGQAEENHKGGKAVLLEIVILMDVFIGVLMLIILLRQNQMKKKIDAVIKEVEDYISFITENPEEENDRTDIEERENWEKTTGSNSRQKSGKYNQEVSQNRLIQEVLGEYFP